MRFTLGYPPSTNTLYATVRGGRRIKSAKAKRYKTDSGLRMRMQRVACLYGDVRVTIVFYRPRKAGDIDNLLKATLDAISGFGFVDDSQVKHIDAKLDDTDKANPRAVVTVEAI